MGPVALPSETGYATLSGICLDRITAKFPNYPLKTAESDFSAQFSKVNKGFPKKLPNLPNNVGGEVDIMISIQYLKYFPEVASLKSGQSLYQSVCKKIDGSNVVIT